jgi:hypothetical protein
MAGVARSRPLDGVRAFYAPLTEPPVDLSEICEGMEARVYDTLLLSGKAASSLGATALRAAVRQLTSRGIFVVQVTTSPLDRQRLVGSPLYLKLTTTRRAATSRVVEALKDQGLRPRRILTLLDSPNDPLYLPLAWALRHSRLLPHARELVPPFALGGPDAAFFEKTVTCLPVCRPDGRRLAPRRALATLIRTVSFARRITVAEYASIIRTDRILETFPAVRKHSELNRRRGLAYLEARHRGTLSPPPEILDHRSGAVVFDPLDWADLCKRRSTRFPKLVDYFDALLPDYLQPDHPCKRRALYTPTKLLLRGEQYYVNMRNESPFRRMDRMWQELDDWAGLALHVVRSIPPTTSHDLKLLLAYVDQSRSIALQTYSYFYAAVRLFNRADPAPSSPLCGNARSGVHGLLSTAVQAYYSCLFGRYRTTHDSILSLVSTWRRLRTGLRQAHRQYERKARRLEPDALTSLVRRWREADHPGENCLAAACACSELAAGGPVHAVGIGWGGIELPLVYAYVASLDHPHDETPIWIATWSHYRSPDTPVSWSSFPAAGQTPDFTGRDRVLLFDDNTLTGTTLERIRDTLILQGASRLHLYVTRYSGERRAAQMHMRDHGAVDPDVLRTRIGGYIGETPFARSWSRKTYKNPIGVFSLSRRRILECIHSNSTVELYDREGF